MELLRQSEVTNDRLRGQLGMRFFNQRCNQRAHASLGQDCAMLVSKRGQFDCARIAVGRVVAMRTFREGIYRGKPARAVLVAWIPGENEFHAALQEDVWRAL
jgi:hypothetical protein